MDEIRDKVPEELERHYTLSIDEDARRASFETEDSRWETRKQVRDWVFLVIAIIFWLAFQLSFYFLVPGIK